LLDDAQHPFTLLRGKLGSGKSTLVAYLAAHCSEVLIDAWETGRATAAQNLWPIRIQLRDIGKQIPGDLDAASPELVWEFVEAELARRLPQADAHAVARELRTPLTRHGAFFFDGLDEIPEVGGRRGALRATLELFAEELGPDARILVTSRPHALTENGRVRGLHHHRLLTIALLDPERIERFIDAWYRRAQPAEAWDDAIRERYAADLKVALRERPYLAELAARPLLLTLIATLHLAHTRLPEDRADLYEGIVGLLLSRWHRKLSESETELIPENLTGILRSHSEIIRDRLQALAYRLHERHQGFGDEAPDATVNGVNVDEILGLFARFLPPNIGPLVLLDFLNERAGLLVLGSNGLYDFPHRSCREYLAACYLVDTESDPGATLVDLVRTDPDWWREVFLLAVGKARLGGMANALAIVVPLLPEEGAAAGTLQEAQWRDIALAARALVELRVAERSPDHPFTQQALRTAIRWVRRLVDEGRLSARERGKAAECLAQLGHRRPGVGRTQEGDPDIGWVPIRGGQLRVREGKRVFQVVVPGFEVARYPVTVEQFQAFIDGDGYHDQEFWNPEGWEWLKRRKRRQPTHWHEQRPYPTQAAVGISWYEAMAFCRWLSARAQAPVRLPSEIEWEFSARGETDRRYPWGSTEKDAAERANTRGNGIDEITSVGIYPRGATPEGVMDLAGNVWEWCCDLFEEIQQFERIDCAAQTGPGPRTIRGGSWWNALEEARCASRAGARPAMGDRNVGFRVVLTADTDSAR
jgi:formylglycine-generating enzyme required for sulfatase activity